VVSGAITPEGTTGRLIRLGVQQRYRIVACPYLLDELRTVLERPGFRRYISIAEVVDLVDALEGVAEMMPDPERVPSVTRDPGDDYLVALAQLSNADRLVSGDPDVLNTSGPPVHVCGPRALLDEIDAAS
jgi:uncharacterized protein